jgi:hypothetical protein
MLRMLLSVVPCASTFIEGAIWLATMMIGQCWSGSVCGKRSSIYLEGHFARGNGSHEQSLYLSRESGDRRSESVTLNNLGTVLQYRGDYG